MSSVSRKWMMKCFALIKILQRVKQSSKRIFKHKSINFSGALAKDLEDPDKGLRMAMTNVKRKWT